MFGKCLKVNFLNPEKAFDPAIPIQSV